MAADGISNNTINYITLIIGWALGILSAMFIDFIKNFNSKKEIRKGVITELRDLKIRMIAYNYEITLDYSEITKEWSNWIRPRLELLNETNEYDYLLDKKIDKSQTITSNEDEFYNQLISINKINNTVPIYSQISLPYIDSKYDYISQLGEIFLMKISQLKNDIIIYNWELEKCWYYHTKYFEITDDFLLTTIKGNVDHIKKVLKSKSKDIITLIETIN